MSLCLSSVFSKEFLDTTAVVALEFESVLADDAACGTAFFEGGEETFEVAGEVSDDGHLFVAAAFFDENGISPFFGFLDGKGKCWVGWGFLHDDLGVDRRCCIFFGKPGGTERSEGGMRQRGCFWVGIDARIAFFHGF